MDFSKPDESIYKEPIVVSSFYSTPDGSNTVRFYEITNANENIKKLNKKELEELRFENFTDDAIFNLKSFFQGKKATVNSNQPTSDIPKPLETSKVLENDIDAKAKSISYHTRNDGGLLTVTAFDLTKQKGNDLAVQDFVRQQALKKEIERSKSVAAQKQEFTQTWIENTSYSPTQTTQNTKDHHSKKKRGKSYDKKDKKRHSKGSFRENSFDDFDDYDPYLKTNRSYQRFPPPPPQYGMPCNCLECQAKRRAGINSYQCNCIDCTMKRKQNPYFDYRQGPSYF